MQIYGPYRVSTAQTTGPTDRTAAAKPQAPTGKASMVDQLDLSSSVNATSSANAASGANSVNRLAATQSPASDIRVDRVADLRRQIASGTYDTPEKMDAALDRMLDQYA